MSNLSPIILILVGALMIGGGGVIATYGWNQKTVNDRKRSLVRAAAAEVLFDLSVVADGTLHEQGDQFIMFPRTQTIAIDGTDASGSFSSENDKAFLTLATNLRYKLASLNRKLEFTEQRMSVSGATDISTYRQKMIQSAAIQQVQNDLKSFGRLLVSSYGINESDSFYEDVSNKATPAESAAAAGSNEHSDEAVNPGAK